MRSKNREPDESSRLLGTSAPSKIHFYDDLDDEDEEEEVVRERTINPTVGRRYSLAVPNPRIRSNSIVLYNDDEEDVVFTSYGPVILEDTRPRRRERRDCSLGWFLAIISGMLFTACNFFVKYFSIDAIEILMVRSLLQAGIMAFVIVVTKRKFFPEKRLDKILVLVQGVFGGAKTLFQFACVLYMPIGDALTIVFTEPLWTLILSKLILKIRIGMWKLFFGLLLIAGMVLCIQPPFLFPVSPELPLNSTMNETDSNPDALDQDHDLIDSPSSSNYYLGVLMAVCTAMFGALNNVVIARCEKVSSKVMVFYAGLGGVIIAFICSYFDEENKIIYNISAISGNQWLILTAMGSAGIIGHFCMTRSLRLIPPTTVAVLRAKEIILAYVAQAALMGEIPNAISISGSSLVMLSVVAFALEEVILGWIQKLKEYK